MARKLWSAAALPPVPARETTGVGRAGEGRAIGAQVEPARAGPEPLVLEIERASGHRPLNLGDAAQGVSSLHLVSSLLQLHQAIVRKPEAAEIGGLVLGGVRVRPPTMPIPRLATAYTVL